MRGFITDPQASAGLKLSGDLPEPEPASHEMLVEVKAFSINPGELKLVEMRPNGWRPGQDIAGVVIKTAADGSGPPVGSRIAARLDWEGWAERVPVPVQRAARCADDVSFEQAATLPVAGLTALRALWQGGAVLGRRVLVTGATGGVGQFAVQLAALAGAHVTAQVSTVERGTVPGCAPALLVTGVPTCQTPTRSQQAPDRLYSSMKGAACRIGPCSRLSFWDGP